MVWRDPVRIISSTIAAVNESLKNSHLIVKGRLPIRGQLGKLASRLSEGNPRARTTGERSIAVPGWAR